MKANETIGQWAVKKGLIGKWLEEECTCGDPDCILVNPNYSIYEELAPVLQYFRIYEGIQWVKSADKFVLFKRGDKEIDQSYCVEDISLPTTLRDMVAELISKGEV